MVDFGTTAATNVTVVNDTTITAVSPAGTGIVDVTVTGPAGTSATSAADQFTYAAAPTVTGLSPTSGPAAGGTSVTITGTGFTGATAVDFGTTAATGVTVVNDTTVTATSSGGNWRRGCDRDNSDGHIGHVRGGSVHLRRGCRADRYGRESDHRPCGWRHFGDDHRVLVSPGPQRSTSARSRRESFTVVNDTTINAPSARRTTGTVNVTVVTPNGTSPGSAAEQFTFAAAPPTVASLVRFGFHMQQTSLVLTFSTALNPTPAQDVNNYQILTMNGTAIPISSAVYDPANLTVTLVPSELLSLHTFYQLTVNGATPNGLTSSTGVPLDGQGNGTPGTNFVSMFGGGILVGPAPAMLTAQPKRFAAEKKQLAADEKKWAAEVKKANASRSTRLSREEVGWPRRKRRLPSSSVPMGLRPRPSTRSRPSGS